MSQDPEFADPIDLSKARLRGLDGLLPPVRETAEVAVPVPQPGPSGTVHPAQLRASTADRERVSQILQRAMADGRITPDELSDRLEIVYQAKTLGELEPVTRDLPEHQPLVPVMRAAAPGELPTVPAQPAAALPPGVFTSSTAIAVMSGAQRSGIWAVPASFTAVAVMGGVEIDLTEAIFTAGEVTITAFALMGGIDIKVPDDVMVKEDGIGLMGGFESKVPPPTELPRAIVRIRGLAMMGGVEVRRLTEKERRKRAKLDRKQRDS